MRFDSAALRVFHFLGELILIAPDTERVERSSRPDRKVAERWTSDLSKSWTPVSDFFLKNYHKLKISHSEAMVIIHLISFKWDSKAPYPSLKTIAKLMGLTDSSVRSHVRKLEKRGLLNRVKNQGYSNSYELEGLFDALEGLAEKMEPPF